MFGGDDQSRHSANVSFQNTEESKRHHSAIMTGRAPFAVPQLALLAIRPLAFSAMQNPLLILPVVAIASEHGEAAAPSLTLGNIPLLPTVTAPFWQDFLFCLQRARLSISLQPP